MFLTLNHQKRDIYNFSKNFVIECYKVTKTLPAEEKFRMTSQIRRAALSVHLHIAAGSSRKSETERKSFYEIARGSIIGVDAAFDIANDLKYLTKDGYDNLSDVTVRCFKVFRG